MKSDPNNYNLNFFDHDFNEAIITDSRTNEIEEMWEQVFPNEDDLNFLKTAICKHLIGVMTKHIIFLKGSNGNNGKSTLLSLLVSALGTMATSFQGDILCKTITHSKPMPELAMLKDKLIVVTQEPDTEEKFNTETIKSLTGGDVLHSRRLYENDAFELTNKALLLSGCNSMPSFTKNDKALFGQRIRVIEITTEFVPPEEYADRKEEDNVYLGDSKYNEPLWRKEAEVYMLHLLIKWLKQGYAERDLKQTESMKKAKMVELEDSQELMMLNLVAEKTKVHTDILALNEVFEDISKKDQVMGKREWIKALKTNVMTAGDFKERHSKKRSVLKGWKKKEIEFGDDEDEFGLDD
jgi:phage/plasmid-associated DNA primase